MNTETTVQERAPEETNSERVDTRNWIVPLVDIYENADELRVEASMPGVNSDDIEVTFEKGVLRIAAPVRSNAHSGTVLLQEFAPEGYERTFRISERVASDKIAADFSSGVLTLHLPKQEAAKPRSIPVNPK